MSKYVMALDQGTTSSRALLFDREGQIAAVDQYEFTQHFPQPGWVEHDPMEIWESQLRAARGVLEKAGASAADVVAIGITNQRETAVVWDRATGEPIHPAIVWQSRQTAAICEGLRARGLEDEVRARTGLVIDAYFSATKIRFILDAVDGAQKRAEAGDLCFGTVDSWLLYKLTHGRVHATEYSNASRTLVYNIHDLDWDDRLLGELDIPRRMLPEVRDSSGEFGVVASDWLGGEIPCGRDRRRSAGVTLRTGLLRVRHREEYVRNRLLLADEHGRPGGGVGVGARDDIGPGGWAGRSSMRSREAYS